MIAHTPLLPSAFLLPSSFSSFSSFSFLLLPLLPLSVPLSFPLSLPFPSLFRLPLHHLSLPPHVYPVPLCPCALSPVLSLVSCITPYKPTVLRSKRLMLNEPIQNGKTKKKILKKKEKEKKTPHFSDPKVIESRIVELRITTSQSSVRSGPVLAPRDSRSYGRTSTH